MPKPEELIVLVDDQDRPIATRAKHLVHNSHTPLHRGFSVFVFGPGQTLLLQQRSRFKVTWPLVWSNSCCGHPGPGESPENAASRRLADELGLRLNPADISVILPDYRYRCELDGMVENEFCPVMAVFTGQAPTPQPSEVEATRYVAWPAFLAEAKSAPQHYSPWSTEEALLLSQNPAFKKLWDVWYNI